MSNQSNFGFGFGGVLLGAGIGFIIGLLYAPRSGVETRAMVTEKIDEYWGQGQELYSRGVERMHNGYNAVSAKVSEASSRVKPFVDERSDELRSKIEEARERIAAEVNKNAAAHDDSLADALESAAGAASDAVDDAAAGASA